MPRYAVVFTAYGWDDFHEAQFRRNAARAISGDMHVVADESNGVAPVPSAYRKTVASAAGAEALGLRVAYHRALFWHNIDYLYYFFYDRYPAYDYYIFLDYDAVVDLDIDSLVAEIDRRGIDYAGDPVKGAISDWGYGRQHAPIYGAAALEARISAVTILSNRALAHLFLRRRQDSAAPSRHHVAFWPFCEAFVPMELKREGYVLADLAAFGDVTRFAWWPPTLDTTLSRPVSDGAAGRRFVHPVLDRPRFIASMLRHAKTLDFVLPWSRLWRAVATCPDRRWAKPLLVEMARRVRRVLLGRSMPSAVEVVGMDAFETDRAPAAPPTFDRRRPQTPSAVLPR